MLPASVTIEAGSVQTQVRFLPRPLILNYIIMPNMSYCRFENTVSDMQDCINAIEDGDTSDLSRSEIRALEEFLDLAREITNLEYEIEEILENYEN
jgi:hypothetical protein